MRKIMTLICMSLLTFACTQSPTSQTQDDALAGADDKNAPLRLNNISFDDKTPKQIRQIVFTFNQAVAIVGALPTPRQIDSIAMSHDLAQHCTWRFVTLQSLACELNRPLKPYTQYDISVSAQFNGLNKSLDLKTSPQKETAIVTGFEPDTDYFLSQGDDFFPTDINLFFGGLEISGIESTYSAESDGVYSTNNSPKAELISLLEQAQILTPNGQRIPVALNDKNRQASALQIKLPSFEQNWGSGSFKLIMPRDFAERVAAQANEASISWPYRTLAQDDILYEFDYRSAANFIGFVCINRQNNRLIDSDYLLSNTAQQDILYTLPCPPAKIAFAFSRPLDDLSERYAPPTHPFDTGSNFELDWLKGPEYKFTRYLNDNNMHIYHFELQGFAQYSMDLGAIKYDQSFSSEQTGRINFITQDPITRWQFYREIGTTIEADASILPHFMRSNVPNMQVVYTPLKTSEALLVHLNGDPLNSLARQQAMLAPTKTSPHKPSLQALDIISALDERSGLVVVALAGASAVEEYAEINANNDAILSDKKDQFMSNAAGFNVAVWHLQDLLIQALDWQAKAVANANVELVCEGQAQPKLLGQTNHSGLLLIDQKEWQNTYYRYRESTCWLWLQQHNDAPKNMQSAAIELPKASIDSFINLRVNAYSTQPIYEAGDYVDIGLLAHKVNNTHTNGASEQSAKGPQVTPLNDISNFRFTLVDSEQENILPLDFAPISAMGFSHTSITLPKDLVPGRYSIQIHNIENEDSRNIGAISVAEFSPPEFEQSLVYPEQLSFGQTLELNIRANRMNGVALQGAKSQVEFTMGRNYSAPDDWPEDYSYSSYAEYKEQQEQDKALSNQHSLSKSVRFASTIDESGRVSYSTEAIQSSIAFGKIHILSEVIASDGLAVDKNASILYVGREYIIGSKRNVDDDTFDLIAINARGEEVKGISANLSFIKKTRSSGIDKTEVVDTCTVKSLPASCSLAKILGSVDIEIRTRLNSQNSDAIETQAYRWYRNIYRSEPEQDVPKDSLEIRLLSDKEQFTVGDTINFNLVSTVAGMATFILESGTIDKVWQQPVNVGDNAIVMQADESLMPHARVYVSLPLSREKVNAFIAQLNDKAQLHDKTQLDDQAQLDDKIQSAKVSPRLPETTTSRLTGTTASNHMNPYLYREARLLQTSTHIVVTPSSPEPSVSIEVVSGEGESIYAGSEVQIKIKASAFNTATGATTGTTSGDSQDSTKYALQERPPIEAQIWLVNEALWPFTMTSESTYDFGRRLYADDPLRRQLLTHSLNKDLVLKDAAGMYGDAKIAVMGMRMGAAPMQADSSNMEMFGGELKDLSTNGSALSIALSQLNPRAFAQSLWIGQVELSAGEQKTITSQLPQLIGRWKVVAISASSTQSTVNSTSFTTQRKREYFVDAPRDIIQGDTSSVAISQINNSDKAQQDTLSIWLNEALYSELKISLDAEEFKRVEIDLPPLNIGKNTIVITSEQEPDYIAMHHIHVKRATKRHTLRWLSSPNSENKIMIAMPDSALANSLELSYQDSKHLRPDWPSLVSSNRDYAYQCWEQNLSRAVAYTQAKNAQTYWPEGLQNLQALLAKQALYRDFVGNYQFYPQQPADAFLTAYTYLTHAWLHDTPLSFSVSDSLKDNLLNMLNAKSENTENAENVEYKRLIQFNNQNETLNKSMALLALAANKAITLKQALTIRQSIGISGSQSSEALSALVLQGLALKTLNANPSQYRDVLVTLENARKQGYQDTYNTLFNQSSDKCYAAMLYDEGSQMHAALVQEVLAEQADQGHFGSTFADAVCAKLLAKLNHDTDTAPIQVDFEIKGEQIVANSAAPQFSAQYRLQYEQPIRSSKATQNGLSIQRTLSVQREGEWISLDNASPKALQIGDLVKTELRLYSARERQHIGVTDSIAGGFEAVNPNLQNRLYQGAFDQSWFYRNHISIQNGEASWQLRYLAKGETTLVYFSRVRHSGEFLLAPAVAEAMYRMNVRGSTSADKINVFD